MANPQAAVKEEVMKSQMSGMVVGLFLIVSLCIGNVLEVAPAEANSVTLEVLNPRAEFEPPPNLAIVPRVTDLAGKKIGLYWNGKPGEIPEKGVNFSGEWFKGKIDKDGKEITPSHKNARFTSSLRF
jgi:hypothetical protein